MIVWELKLFGKLPLLVVSRTNYELVEEDAPTHGGGSAHNFELAEQFVDERYLPWEEDRFGFHA